MKHSPALLLGLAALTGGGCKSHAHAPERVEEVTIALSGVR